jgi:hypothetical protein
LTGRGFYGSLRLAAAVEPYAFDTSWGILSKELIGRCHRLGIRVFSDAIGRHERIEDYRQGSTG